MQNFCFSTFFICDTASRLSLFVKTVCNVKNLLCPSESFLKLKVENGKLKIENCGQADSLQTKKYHLCGEKYRIAKNC